MTDEKALLAAIWAHPHEDTPRLMYADWLDENGQPERAEFIRVQCERARLESDWDDLPPELVQREEALWKKWRTKWRSRLPKQHRTCEFHRGFPLFWLRFDRIRDLLKMTVADLEFAPTSRCGHGFRAQSLLDALKWPGLRFLSRFSLSPPLPRGWAKRVAACENLRNVSELDLGDCKLKPAEFRLLLDAWADRHLTDLQMPGQSGDAELEVLAAQPAAAGLRDLRVGKGTVTSAGIRALRTSRHLTRLRALVLHCPTLGGEGLRELLRWRHLDKIRFLGLNESRLSDAGAVAIAECPGLSELRSLSLMSNEIGADGCTALVRSPHLNRLRTLWLDLNPGPEKPAVRKALRQRYGEAVDF